MSLANYYKAQVTKPTNFQIINKVQTFLLPFQKSVKSRCK